MREFANILIATANAGKTREFREMLSDSAIEFTDLNAQQLAAPVVEETGKTFLENASLKASAYALHYRLWSLADDSGLEVDALDGSPGIYSARWAQLHDAGVGDLANNALLLEQLRDVPDEKRTARFVCALALANPVGEIILTSRGVVEGRILRTPRGENGFGYDPLFLIESFRQTAAEMSADRKHAISHRGEALREMRKLIANLE